MLFVTLGIIYFVVMMYGVFNIKVPAEGWRPAGFDPATLKAKTLVTTNNVSAGNAIKTPQFYFLWLVLFCNVTAGIGILEQASPMIQDFFRSDGGVSTVDRSPRPAASSASSRWPTWPAGSSGPRRPTTSAASRST